MTGRLAAFILLSTVYSIQTVDIPPHMSLTVAELGENVTLQCAVSEKEGKFFQWYKLPPGYMVQTVATGTYTRQTLSAQFNNSRFRVTEGEAHYLLTIKNVSKDDEATYFCQTGTAYSQRFVNATFLAVNDHNQLKSVNVKQSPETASAQPGDSVTLRCSLVSENKDVECPGEHSVYWFRAGSRESHPNLIYTHTHGTDEEEKRSCVHSLSKTIRDSSDAGTYYCAVVTCGEILFGEGTKVNTRQEWDPLIMVLGILLALCLVVIGFLIFSRD